MRRSPVLIYGFEPRVTETIRQLTNAVSKPADILHLSSPSVSDVRNARDFAFRAPMDMASSLRTLILDIATLNESSYQALLRLLEELPDSTQALMTSDSLNDIPATILSRCIKIHKEAGDFGTRFKSFTDMGLSVARAAEVATSTTDGLTSHTTPMSEDVSTAATLVEAIKTGNMPLGLTVIPYGRKAEDRGLFLLTALRRALLESEYLDLLPHTYANAPVNSIMVRCLQDGLKRRR